MIERVSIEQHTFRVPGLARDRRGVLIGKRTLLLFPSLDRTVSFLAMCGEQGALGELLRSLKLHRVQSASRSHELALTAEVYSGRELDQIAGIARIAHARTYIGGRKHFVPFRDVRAPAGYDATSLDECDDDVVLYDDQKNTRFRWGRALSLVDLVGQLELRRNPTVATNTKVTDALVWAPSGLTDAMRRYLLDREVHTQIAISEFKSDSILDDGPTTAALFRLAHAPRWVVNLFVDIPQVRVFLPASKRCFVEHGYRHPLPLGLFDEQLAEGLHLFEAPSAQQRVHRHGRTLHISPEPTFVQLFDAITLRPETSQPLKAHAASTLKALSIALRTNPNGTRNAAVATMIPVSQRGWLAKLMYLMPEQALEGLEVAIADDWIFIYRAAGLMRLPLGQHFTAHMPDLFVPEGHGLQPAAKPEELREALPLLNAHRTFVGPGTRILYVPKDAFGALTRSALRDLEGALVSANRPHYETRDLIFVDYDG